MTIEKNHHRAVLKDNKNISGPHIYRYLLNKKKRWIFFPLFLCLTDNIFQISPNSVNITSKQHLIKSYVFQVFFDTSKCASSVVVVYSQLALNLEDIMMMMIKRFFFLTKKNMLHHAIIFMYKDVGRIGSMSIGSEYV